MTATAHATTNPRPSDGGSDLLSKHMAQTHRYALLTRAEERELATRWQEDEDEAAVQQLVTANLRLVAKLAYEYRWTRVDVLDLMQEGNLGLMRAVRRFDPERGVRLSTYATWWIRAYMLKFLVNNARLVRLGTTNNQRKLFFNLRAEQARLQAMGISADPELLAENLDVSPAEVVDMDRRLSSHDESLDAPVGLGSTGVPMGTRMDRLAADDPGPEADLGQSELRETLRRTVSRFAESLSEREQEVLRDRLLAERPVTFRKLGERWAVSRERPRQIERRVRSALRRFLRREIRGEVTAALGHA